MRLHGRVIFVLIALFSPSSSAFSDHTTNILQHLTSVSESLDATRDALAQYKGGYLGMVPLAQRAYDVWARIRVANTELGDLPISPDESVIIVERMKPLSTKATEILEEYKPKDHLVQAMNLSFLYPILLDAIHKEANDYMATVQKQVSEEYKSPIDQISAEYSAAIDSVIGLCTANLGGSSGLLQGYDSGLSVIKQMALNPSRWIPVVRGWIGAMP